MQKILYIEDDALNLRLVRKMLKTLDYDMIEVRNGLDAARVALYERPDVILLDIQLLDISGLDVARELKSHPEMAHIPVIVVTADPSNYQACQAAGCDGYLTKPLSRTSLLKTIVQFLPHA